LKEAPAPPIYPKVATSLAATAAAAAAADQKDQSWACRYMRNRAMAKARMLKLNVLAPEVVTN